jgi:VWFA-related protein
MRFHSSRWLQLATLILVCVAGVAQVKETISVNVVEVPVTVVDNSGNPVRGLTAANFKLLDNGKERAISSFDTIDFSPARSAEGSKLALARMNPAARRNFLLLFDLANSSPRSLSRAQDAARSFVQKAAQPRDLIGIGTIDADTGFHLITAFTTDRELIASVIANPANYHGSDPLQLSNDTKMADLDTTLPVENASGPTNSQGRQEIVAAENKDRMAQIQQANAEYVRAKVQKQVEYLGQLAKVLRAVPGRKQIVLLSEGFDPSVISGRDAHDSKANTADNENVTTGRSYLVDNDARYGSTTSQTFVTKMAQFFRGSDVVLHAIDIQGVRVQNDVQTGARINSNAGLALLADPTGGLVFQNSNDMTGNFDRMLKAQEVVYVLAFQASSLKPGEFHNLSVKLVNVPGSAKAFSRAGYYEGGGETAVERRLTSAEIILNDIPQNDIRVAALAAPFPAGGAAAQVPVVLEIDGMDVIKDLKTNSAAVEVYLYAFDADGMVRDRIFQNVNVDLKKAGEKLRNAGIKYYATLMLPAGTYAVKALVNVPETGRKGFARADIVVPKQGDTAVLPPIFVEDTPKWVMVKNSTHATEAPYPFMLDGHMFIPSVGPHVKSGETTKFAVFVHNAKPNEVTFESTPKVKFLGASSAAAGTALVMEMGTVDPSLATLNITVKAKGTSQTSSVAIQ